MSSKDTRERILETASKLIHARGYGNTSVSDILAESGITKGVLFYYFATKEDLGFAVLERLAEQFKHTLTTQIFRPELKPIDQIHTLFDFEVKLFKEKGTCSGCPFGNLASELADHHEKFRKKIADFLIFWENMIRTALDKAKQDGTLRPDLDSQSAAAFILSSMEGALILMRAKQDISPLVQTTEQLKNYLNSFRIDLILA